MSASKKAKAVLQVPEGMVAWYLDVDEAGRIASLVHEDLKSWGADGDRGFLLRVGGPDSCLFCHALDGDPEPTPLGIDLLARSDELSALIACLYLEFPDFQLEGGGPEDLVRIVKQRLDAAWEEARTAQGNATDLKARLEELQRQSSAELEGARRNINLLRSDAADWAGRHQKTSETLDNTEASLRRVCEELETLQRESSAEVAGLRRQLEEARRVPRGSEAPIRGEVSDLFIRTAEAAEKLGISNVALLQRQKNKTFGDPIGKLTPPIEGHWSRAEVNDCFKVMFPNGDKR